jgi:Ankyrin repeats (3 copies)
MDVKHISLKKINLVILFLIFCINCTMYAMENSQKKRQEIERRIKDADKLDIPLHIVPVIGLPVLIEVLQNDFLHDLIEPLLKSGANPNITNTDGHPALCYALVYSYSKGIKNVCLLLHYKADPNARNKRGCTPLMLAGCCHNYEAVKILLEHNANPNLQDDKGRTVLVKVLKGYDHDQDDYRMLKLLIGLLLYHGANPFIQDKYGKTTIDIAGKQGLPLIAKLMKNAKPHLVTMLTALLSRGDSRLNYDVAHYIAQMRYQYDY